MEEPSRFLQLPRELRDAIFMYACAGNVFKIQERDIKQASSINARPGLRYNVNLLLTSRQVHEEAKDAIITAYTENIFHFDSAKVLRDFGCLLPASDLAAITQVQIDLTNLGKDIPTLSCWLCNLPEVLADNFPGLLDLYVYMSEENVRFEPLPPLPPLLPIGSTRVMRQSVMKHFREFDKTPKGVFDQSTTKQFRMGRVPKPKVVNYTWLGTPTAVRWQIGGSNDGYVLMRSKNIPIKSLEWLFFRRNGP